MTASRIFLSPFMSSSSQINRMLSLKEYHFIKIGFLKLNSMQTEASLCSLLWSIFYDLSLPRIYPNELNFWSRMIMSKSVWYEVLVLQCGYWCQGCPPPFMPWVHTPPHSQHVTHLFKASPHTHWYETRNRKEHFNSPDQEILWLNFQNRLLKYTLFCCLWMYKEIRKFP